MISHLSPAVSIADLRVRYRDFEALGGVSLSVAAGEILAILGPNGAGKTTLVRTCATLVQPSSGSVRIDGHDVVTDAAQVRQRIGLTGQYAALDDDLTARENLELMGALLGVPERVRRAGHLIDQLDLSDIAERRIGTLSGGSRRKADLAASMVGSPTVLFLDEPTTGLDPRARLKLWDAIEDLRSTGTAVVLTTQYLEEAERLANRIILINHGQVVAEGTPDELKARLGGRVVHLRLADKDHVPGLRQALAAIVHVGPDMKIDARTGDIDVVVPDAVTAARVVAEASRLQLPLAEIAISTPSLDDVFLHLTETVGAMPA
ncbi:ATP-binding cassette domain-containing protein [Kribbella sp. NPDC004536]|uniref:ATP-binding cassette domain-containing protein n=1 Tax=Kribbella sp. NPDC004536 TaxID=3364106 RepID=UPI003695C2F9